MDTRWLLARLNLLKQSNYTKNYDVTVYMLYSKEETYLKELQSTLLNVDFKDIKYNNLYICFFGELLF